MNKYKIGDKVKIKKDIITEELFCNYLIPKIIKKLNYILTIKSVENNKFYIMKELYPHPCQWKDNNIKCLHIEPGPIESRFEILDL